MVTSSKPSWQVAHARRQLEKMRRQAALLGLGNLSPMVQVAEERVEQAELDVRWCRIDRLAARCS